jgi:hypothetical protein
MTYLKKSDYTGYKFKEPEPSYGNESNLRVETDLINEITIQDFRP